MRMTAVMNSDTGLAAPSNLQQLDSLKEQLHADTSALFSVAAAPWAAGDGPSRATPFAQQEQALLQAALATLQAAAADRHSRGRAWLLLVYAVLDAWRVARHAVALMVDQDAGLLELEAWHGRQGEGALSTVQSLCVQQATPRSAHAVVAALSAAQLARTTPRAQHPETGTNAHLTTATCCCPQKR